MKLTANERMTFYSLCPTEGADIITQTLVRDLLEKVELSQSEIKTLNVRPNEGGGIKWDEPNEVPLKNVTFSELELGLLKGQVDKFDNEKKVSQRMLSLCLKIQKELVKKAGELD